MKGIYIVLSHTGTTLSKIIKAFTKDEFSHVSISLDIDAKEMYSFGRLRAYNAFIAGFVHEYINKGTFRRFRNTMSKIYYLEVTNEQYDKIKNIIEQMKAEKEKYKFNILGLFAAGFHKKIGKKGSFYCAEFVKYLMDEAEIETNLPEVVKPEDFKQLENLEEIYSGLLRQYPFSKRKIATLLQEKLFVYGKKESLI